MSRHLSSLACLLALSALFGSCSSEAGASPTKLRFSGIPDADKAKLNADGKVVEEYLKKELGVDVEFVESANYTAACNGVANNKLDLAWLGGVTSVQAEERSKGAVKLVTCRESDLQFHSYLIASKVAVDAGKIKKVDKLEDAKEMLKNCTFTFGDKSSTSGRVMPQYFLAKAGIDVDNGGVKGKPKFQAKGGHVATLETVASGAVDTGVLNYKTYDAASDDLKAKAVVIYKTPAYVDYCMVANNQLGRAMIDKIRSAFTKLDAGNPEHKKVLDAFSAEKFVSANPQDWDQIRMVLKTIKLD